MTAVVGTTEASQIGAPPPLRERSTRKRWLFLLKGAVSAALLLWILTNAELDAVARALRGADRWQLLAALLLYTATYYVRAIRWRILLRAQGVDASLRFLLSSYFASIFFSNFLPSTIGGDAVRGYDSWRAGASTTAAVAVLLLDRLLGMVVLVLFALVLLLVSPELVTEIPHLRLWMALLTASLLGFAYLPFHARWRRLAGWTEKIRAALPRRLWGPAAATTEAFRAFQGRGDVLATVLVLSVVFQAATVVHYYLIARALDLPVPFLAFFVLVPLAIIIMMLPVSINAIGLREGVFAFLFASYGVSTAQAVAYAWLVYVVVLLLGVAGGVIYVLRREERAANRREEVADEPPV